MFVGLSIYSCTLEEYPKFPSSEVLFSNVEGANTVLNGVYSGIADFNYMGADFMHLTYLGSGMYNSNRDNSLKDIGGLKPYPSLNFVENVWKGAYRVIARANDVIAGLDGVEFDDEDEQNNILGQAYFLRAYTYFDLVRIYGGLPLLTTPPDVDNINKPRASVQEVYQQIIADAGQAKLLLPESGAQSMGRPSLYAANMLLAKVYMEMAGNDNSSQYWQSAYDEAIEVYGKFALVGDYNSLWEAGSTNHTSESIFEIMGNEENTLRLHQLFTASNGNIGRSVWGRIKPNIELYDTHANKYPGDPRVAATFKTEFIKFNSAGKESTIKTYPTFSGRNNKDKSYPWLNKYYIKDIYSSNYNTNMNYVAYRYADLLLMLAEISNELNLPEAFGYVNEVLGRARQSASVATLEPQDWSGLSQEDFREAIMLEYRHELLGEGQDYFNMKRRGYEFFKKHVIDAHNNHTAYNFSKARDVEYEDNDRIMLMPFPATEITANPNMSATTDQNPGY
jgi:hypothetical protein